MNSGESADPLDTTGAAIVSFSKTALHTLFGESHLGILIFDKQGQIHYRNPRAVQLLKTGRMRDLERILAKPSVVCTVYPSYIIVDTSVNCSQVFRIDDLELPNQFVLRTIAPVNMPAFENEVCGDKHYSANIILILDQHGTIMSCSEAVEQVTQLPLDHIVGKNFIELTSPLPGFPLLSLEKACERSLQCCIRLGEQDSWVNVSVKPIYEGDDVAQYIVAICDIAGIKRQRLEKAQQEKMAAIGQMAARLAHEIKNPLTSIKGFLQLIQLYLESGNRKKLEEYLATALTETEHLSNLVTDFLNYALPSQPHTEIIEVNQLLEDTLLLLRRVCNLHNIECTTAVKDCNLAIVGDRQQVQQILLNIAYNAIDALKEVPQRKLLLAAAANGSMCELSVTNTGPQIPREVVNSIFDPFFTTKDSGTGLGLSTCARLAHENGGHIEVSTTPQLTTFHIFLPLAQDRIREATAN